MTNYAVALTFPREVKQEIIELQAKYKKYVTYRIEPHVTLKYPFATEVNITSIDERLREVAHRSSPFTLVLNGIKYFEGQNNVAYFAVENKEPVMNLHSRIVHSLEDLDKEESMGVFDLERFTPHATIGEQIPQEVFLCIKQALDRLNLRYEFEVDSYTLFSAREDDIWKSVEVFEFRDKGHV